MNAISSSQNTKNDCSFPELDESTQFLMEAEINPELRESVLEKQRSGLSRAQALDVIRRQREHDKTECKIERVETK